MLNIIWQTSKADIVGLAQTIIEEDVTQSIVHMGEVLTPKDDKRKGIKGGVKDHLTLIDENYVGSFKIKKSMTINAYKKQVKEISDGLPDSEAISIWMRNYTDADWGAGGLRLVHAGARH